MAGLAGREIPDPGDLPIAPPPRKVALGSEGAQFASLPMSPAISQ